MNRLFFYAIVVALAGFLFGFDTVVISGAEQSLEALWDRGPVFHGWVVMSSALWGTVIGAILGGIPIDRYGRRATLIAIGVLYVISALGSAMASGPWFFAVLRFIGGLGVGASTVAAPAYVTEIAPPAQRGRLVALYQFNIVFGILMAFISNYVLSGIAHDAWRWMIGIEAVPAVVYTILVFFVPESPRWLMVRYQDEDRARNILSSLFDKAYVDEQIGLIKKSLAEGVNRTKDSIFDNRYRSSMWLAFFIAFFNQFSGINAFLYYAPRIFATAGMADSTAFFSSIGIGIVNLVFTLIGMFLIDRFGRKQLMIIGSIGYIVSLSMVAAAFLLGWQGLIVAVFFFMFIASHAIGQGAVIWVFISEVFPDHLRGVGQAFGCSVHWILAALIPASIPYLFSAIGAGYVFMGFALLMVGQLIWVLGYMPETKGKTIEALQKELGRQ